MAGSEGQSQIKQNNCAPSERSRRLMQAYDYLRKENFPKKLPPK